MKNMFLPTWLRLRCMKLSVWLIWVVVANTHDACQQKCKLGQKFFMRLIDTNSILALQSGWYTMVALLQTQSGAWIMLSNSKSEKTFLVGRNRPNSKKKSPSAGVFRYQNIFSEIYSKKIIPSNVRTKRPNRKQKTSALSCTKPVLSQRDQH